MKRTHLIFLLIPLFLQGLTGLQAQMPSPVPGRNYFRIAFYNMENLFDTIDNPDTDDQDFLPDAKVPWNSERFDLKIDHMSRVLEAIAQDITPALFGMCEVENREVLEDLLENPRLRNLPYQIIHYQSPDERGIGNALIYLEDQFIPSESRPIGVRDHDKPEVRTRDILYVKGVAALAFKDTLHVFVNHWPSRWGGQVESEPARVNAARILRTVVDSLMNVDPDASILIMGDLNDEPGNYSVRETLGALPPDTIQPGKLYNLMYFGFREGKGTTYYHDWDMFDQVIVSSALLKKKRKGIWLDSREGKIFMPEWLLITTPDGTMRPNRTKGREYYGGYSDHLPVYVDFIIN